MEYPSIVEQMKELRIIEVKFNLLLSAAPLCCSAPLARCSAFAALPSCSLLLLFAALTALSSCSLLHINSTRLPRHQACGCSFLPFLLCVLPSAFFHPGTSSFTRAFLCRKQFVVKESRKARLEMESTNDTNEVIVEIQSTVASSSRSSSRRFRKVWEDFDIVQEGCSPTKKTKAICKHCEKGYSAASRLGTSHLQRHFEGCSKRLKEAHTQLKLLFKEYEMRGSSRDATTRNITRELDESYKEFEIYDSDGSVSSSGQTQLELYLAEKRMDISSDSFDVLGFWKNTYSRYPDLARIARDIMSIPITTVASESSFSISAFEDEMDSEFAGEEIDFVKSMRAFSIASEEDSNSGIK
ncbi:hypothetical protein DITRI_Ditri17bG0095100 [Diplodiscus trichospermus]